MLCCRWFCVYSMLFLYILGRCCCSVVKFVLFCCCSCLLLMLFIRHVRWCINYSFDYSCSHSFLVWSDCSFINVLLLFIINWVLFVVRSLLMLFVSFWWSFVRWFVVQWNYYYSVVVHILGVLSGCVLLVHSLLLLFLSFVRFVRVNCCSLVFRCAVHLFIGWFCSLVSFVPFFVHVH